MRSSLVGLQDGRHLRVRGREQAGDLLGQGLVGGKAGKLALPQIEIAARQPVELAGACGSVAFFRGHEGTIAHRPATAPFAAAARLVALQ